MKTIPGGLPPFWDRSVLFFANIHSIFYENVDETRELIKEISGARSYGGRLLPVLDLLFLGRKNLLLLEDPPDKSLMAYLSGTLGLSLPRCEVIHHADYAKLKLELQRKSPRELAPLLQTLKEHPADWIDGFVTDTALAKIASLLGKRTICSVEGSKNGNNKYLLHRYQMEKRLPTFDTLIASNRDELSTCLESLRRTGYKRVVIKAQIGASGYGMIKQETDAPQLEMVPDYLFFEGPCMVQGWIDQDVSGTKRIGSPSVQMFLDDHTLYLFDLTEQILSEQSVHEGNMSWPLYLESDPAIKDDLLRQAAVAGEWLHRQHYRGTASTDFLVVERGGRTESIICEINARVTGATYPAVLARYFKPEGYWYMRNIRFHTSLEGSHLLSLMDQAGILYRPGCERGILPFNFNTDAEGKVTKAQLVCIAGNRADCVNLLVEAWSHLPIQWGYDRD